MNCINEEVSDEEALLMYDAAMNARNSNRLAQNDNITHAEEAIEHKNNGLPARIYRDAPDDVFELTLTLLRSMLRKGGAKGTLNMFRLVNKRLMKVSEAITECLGTVDMPRHTALYRESLLENLSSRCMRIEHIRHEDCLMSLDGCPDGINTIFVKDGQFMHSLNPLSACKELESLEIIMCSVSDLSPLASCTKLRVLNLLFSPDSLIDISVLGLMPLLQEVNLRKCYTISSMEFSPSYQPPPRLKDLSPLSQCKRLKKLDISCNKQIEDLAPLAQCSQLEELRMDNLAKVKSLKPLSALMNLQVLDISSTKVEDFAPLSTLTNLTDLSLSHVPIEDLTPILPLTKLKRLDISDAEVDDLSPLSALTELEELHINPKDHTSVLPLENCRKLKRLVCFDDTRDCHLLRVQRPDIRIVDPGGGGGDEEEGDADWKDDDDDEGEEEDEEDDEERIDQQFLAWINTEAGSAAYHASYEENQAGAQERRSDICKRMAGPSRVVVQSEDWDLQGDDSLAGAAANAASMWSARPGPGSNRYYYNPDDDDS